MTKKSIIDYIDIDDSLTTELKLQEIKELIVNKVKSKITVFSNPANKQLIKYLAEMIECKIKKSYHCDKLQFLLSILEYIYGSISGDDKNTVITIVEHLVSRKEIRKIPVLSRAFHLVDEFLLPVASHFFFSK